MSTTATVRRLTGGARRRLPSGALRTLRSAALAWGRVTADARLLPGLVIVGAQRSGTTTLFRLLADHPAVFRATLSKGTGYFDTQHHRGMRWYRGHFPLARPASLRAPDGVAPLTFESGGYYSFHPLAVPRIAAELPDARLLFVVRNPVDRAYSAHRHELARGFETEPFARALELEDERLAGEVERIVADPTYESFSHRHHAYLGRSRYSEQLRRMIESVGRDRVFVMDADAFFRAPVERFRDLQEWLGLPVWDPPAVERWNARERDPLDPGLRARLMDHFAPYDEDLERLVGWRPSWRE